MEIRWSRPAAAAGCVLIPVLSSYGLPLGYMGDILGGGFLLSLASFVIATAALETGSPYTQLSQTPGR
jgi:formate hydrogenlyase subunit 4